MFVKFKYGHKKWVSFLAALGPMVLFGILSASALAQSGSGPPPKPSGSINIHQVQVAFNR